MKKIVHKVQNLRNSSKHSPSLRAFFQVIAIVFLLINCHPDSQPLLNAGIEPIDADSINGTKSVCSDGGMLTFGSLSIYVPQQALTTCIQISVRMGDSVQIESQTEFSNINSYSLRPIILEPSGTKFNIPITIKIVANRDLQPGSIIPVLVSETQSTEWRALTSAIDSTPFFGIVGNDRRSVYYFTDHFSKYIQFEPNFVLELVQNCGPVKTSTGTMVPFGCPTFLFDKGLSIPGFIGEDARREAYKTAIRNISIAAEPNAYNDTHDKVSGIASEFLDYANQSQKFSSATDIIAYKLVSAYPGVKELSFRHAIMRIRLANQLNNLDNKISVLDKAWFFAEPIAKTIAEILLINSLESEQVSTRFEILKKSLLQSALAQDPALVAALQEAETWIQNDLAARDASFARVIIQAISNKVKSIDKIDAIAAATDIAQFASPWIVRRFALAARWTVIASFGVELLEWGIDFAAATRAARLFGAYGTIFAYTDISKDYFRTKPQELQIPAIIDNVVERERWQKNLMAEVIISKVADHARGAIELENVHLYVKWLEYASNTLLRIFGEGIDRKGMSNRLKQERDKHQENASAILFSLLNSNNNGSTPPSNMVNPQTTVSPTSGSMGSVFRISIYGCNPNSDISITLKDPDGKVLTPVIGRTNAAGSATHEFATDSNTRSGSWSCWVTDQLSKKSGLASAFTVTATSMPMVSVTPGRGPWGTTFSEPGTGFYPNGGVTLHFRRPDMTEAPTASTTADASGAYSHIFVPPVGTPPGQWQYWAVDNTTSKVSAVATLIITQPLVTVTPTVGPWGTVFNEPGSGFTPGGGVTLHFRRPDMTEAPTASKAADSSGNYTHTFIPTVGTMTGTWQYWAVDNSTGTQSNMFNLVITEPRVSALPSRGSVGTTFDEPGTGFTPNGGVTLHFRRPDGTEAPTALKLANALGSYSHSFASVVGTMTGTWQYWAIDNVTGTSSNIFSLQITP